MIKLEKVEMDQIKRLRKRGEERSFSLFSISNLNGEER